jgi:hypothetical protein
MYSLNEIEAMSKRAAHGANLDWGVAEETGKAIRWLSAHGLPGPEFLAALLKENEGKDHSEVAPVSINEVWQAKSGILSPLAAGAALSDLSGELATGHKFELSTTTLPLLVIPYAAFASKLRHVAVEICWLELTLIITPDGGLSIEGDKAAMTILRTDKICCRAVTAEAEAETNTVLPLEMGREIDSESWDYLNAFAYRNYAPSTTSSREGAGAGLVDND